VAAKDAVATAGWRHNRRQVVKKIRLGLCTKGSRTCSDTFERSGHGFKSRHLHRSPLADSVLRSTVRHGIQITVRECVVNQVMHVAVTPLHAITWAKKVTSQGTTTKVALATKSRPYTAIWAV
jgi:hypothetical protein